MRNRILGIACLTMRQAIRSRFVICLFLLMLSLLVGVALTVKGDGTAAGRLQVLLSYAMSAVGAVLGTAILWLACGSLSTEIESRLIHLVVVKPVHYFELWLGKWLGIVGVALLMLIAAGLFLLAAAQAALWLTPADRQDGSVVRERVLVARDRVAVRRVPGAAVEARWQFDCPEQVSRSARSATLRYQFLADLRDQPAVKAHWVLRSANDEEVFECDTDAQLDGVNRMEIPVDRLRPGQRMWLSFSLPPEADGSQRHVTFHPRHGVELLVCRGGFVGNVLRALLLMFCQVAVLAALGLTAGTVFTFPVAVFLSASLVVATLFSQFFAFSSAPERFGGDHAEGEGGEVSWVEHVGEQLAGGVRFVMVPSLRYHVAGRLAAGVRIPWAEVHEAGGILILGYGGVLCGLGCWVLRRREIALPV